MSRISYARGVALGVLLASCSSNALAAYLFNTGTPNPTNPNDFSPAIARGVQFTVTAPVTITSVEHYAAIDAPDDPNDPNDGVANVRMFIRANASQLCTGGPTVNPIFPCPDGTPAEIAKDIFGSDFSVANTYTNGPTSDPEPRWIGLTGLNWTLNPGTYWVMRTQTRAPNGSQVLFSPFCGDGGGCTGFVGQTYEVSNLGAQLWSPNGARTGWRIGILSRVPEPGTLALLGVGLAGLGLSRRRRVAA
jgi:hypothetical protein